MDNKVHSRTFGMDMRDPDALDKFIDSVARSEDYCENNGPWSREAPHRTLTVDGGYTEHTLRLPGSLE